MAQATLERKAASQSRCALRVRTPNWPRAFCFGRRDPCSSDIETVRTIGSPSEPVGRKTLSNLNCGRRLPWDYAAIGAAFLYDIELRRVRKKFAGSARTAASTTLDAAHPRVPAKSRPRFAGKTSHAQAVFDQTGGLHAASALRRSGRSPDARKRRPAQRRGQARRLANSGRPTAAADKGILVSGRASFELMQKALMAGCPMLVAVGAVEPGRGTRRPIRHDPIRLRPRRALQHLQRRRSAGLKNYNDPAALRDGVAGYVDRDSVADALIPTRKPS